MATMGPGSTDPRAQSWWVALKASSPATSLYRGDTTPSADPGHLIPLSCEKSILLPRPLVTWLSPAMPSVVTGPRSPGIETVSY